MILLLEVTCGASKIGQAGLSLQVDSHLIDQSYNK